MRNNDIYTIQRKIFIKKKYSLMRVQGIISKDQLIDCLSVTGGLLLIVVLLALWKPQDPIEPQELSIKPALGGRSQKESGYRLSIGA